MARSDAILRPVRPGDVEALAAVIRPEDAAEVRAGGHEPLEALRLSVAGSRATFALELGGELAALGGLADGPPASALGPPEFHVPWLLTGPAVARYPVAFVRESRRVIAAFLEQFPLLIALVDARYTAALRWAWRCGGCLADPVAVQPSGLPFHPVVWRQSWATH